MKRSRVIAFMVIGLIVATTLVAELVGMPATPLSQGRSSQETPKAAKITWSVPEVTATMFPGTTSTTTVSFRSSENLTNVILEGTPSLRNVLSVKPASFASISANQNYTVLFTLKAPPEFKKSDFGGTIHLRSAGTQPKAYAQPLGVELKTDWNSFNEPSTKLPLKYPLTWTVESNPVVRPSAISSISFFDSDESVQVTVYANPNGLTLLDWFNAILRGNEYSGALDTGTVFVDSIQVVIVSGRQAMDIKGELFSEHTERLFVSTDDNRIMEFEYVQPADWPSSNILFTVANTLGL